MTTEIKRPWNMRPVRTHFNKQMNLKASSRRSRKTRMTRSIVKTERRYLQIRVLTKSMGTGIKITRIAKKPDEKTTHNGTHCDDQNADQNGNAPNEAGTAVDRIEVDLCDRFGQTVLHYCAARNATSVLEPLLRHSGVCDVQDLQGDTALHVAARRGHDRSLALLLQFGADPSIRNNDGRTALDLAVAAGFADATKVLYENATEPVLRNADALRRQDSVRRCTRIGRIFLEVEVPSQSSATKQL
ncbi:conserved hypothetical protein [Ixodes scapularis]|uniref:Uncharacterized protein n=1 Tax=Ixodes scapularis TaxID=6945 RepID=B7QBR9_IXOSC|nr:conserved hypothetical protein [Ixodes scapularis]|eukprot:XP_002412983.1 conserved hypothetical protein [Ixodes scapularis]